MCIVALAWQVVEGLPICLLSNRDEFYAAESFSGKIESNGTAIVDLYNFTVAGRNENE